MPQTSYRRYSWVLAGVLLCAPLTGWAAEARFLGEELLQLTHQVMTEAPPLAEKKWGRESENYKTFMELRDNLQRELDRALPVGWANKKQRWLKSYSPPGPRKIDDEGLKKALEGFNSALTELVAGASGAAIPASFVEMRKASANDLATGLESRLSAYQIRFGTASERVNWLELGLGAVLFQGDETGPNHLEPIARLSPVNFSSLSDGPVSTFQLGGNWYFLDGPPDGAWSWLRVQNHFGVALALAYPDGAKVLRWNGKPSWGAVLHFDKTEIGITYGGDRRQFGVSLGYAFQFIPMGM